MVTFCASKWLDVILVRQVVLKDDFAGAILEDYVILKVLKDVAY